MHARIERENAPGLDAMDNSKEDAESNAETADDDVGNAEEGVLATEPADGRQHDVLLTIKLVRGVVCTQARNVSMCVLRRMRVAREDDVLFWMVTE
jgi:hypothetical protein